MKPFSDQRELISAFGRFDKMSETKCFTENSIGKRRCYLTRQLKPSLELSHGLFSFKIE